MNPFFLIFLVLTTQVTFAEVLFYASYDQTVHPDKTTSGDVVSQTSNLRFIPGIKGQALVVGSKELVSYPVPGNLPAEQGSISFFAKPIGWDGSDELYHFFISAQAESGDWIVVYKVPEGKLLFVGGTKTNYSYAAANARPWKNGEWKHICTTWKNGDATIYVNGKLVGHGKWPVVSKSFGSEFLVGGTLWGTSSKEQAIDELTIYDKPLTKEEITAYFEKNRAALEKANSTLFPASTHQEKVSKEDGYSFRVSFDTSIDADFSGGSGKGKAVGNVEMIEGVEGKAILVGQDTFVLYDLDGNLEPEKGTLSFWAKPVGWSGKDGQNHYFVILTGEDDWILLQTTVNNLTFLGGKRQAYSITTTPILDWPDGKWRHIIVTWDHGKNCVYFDGKMASCGTWPSVPTSLGDTLRIGGQLFGSSTVKTAIDDFRIYPTAFSKKKIKELYLSSIKNLPAFLAEYQFMEKQEQVENGNLAIAACNAIILPSSQSNSPNVAENIMDGKFETRWVSAIDTFPNWVEVRWPQPVSLYKIVINETPMNKTAEYRIDAYVKGQWRSIVPTKANLRKPGERIEEVFPKIETTKIRYYMLKPAGDPQNSSSSITELQACGTADWCNFKETTKSPGWKSNWIWYPEGEVDDVVRYFRKHFQVDDSTKINEAFLQIAADDTYEVYLNGNYVGSGNIPTTLYNVKKWLKSGDNIIAVKCHEYSIFEGLIAELILNDVDGHTTRIITDNSWVSLNHDTLDWVSVDANEKDWKVCKEEGIPPNSAHASQQYFDVGPKEKFIVQSLKVSPTEVTQDSTAEIKLELDVPVPVKDDYSFILRVGDKDAALFSDYTVASRSFLPSVATSHWVPGEKQSLSVKIYIPDWAPHGKIPIFLTPIGHGVEGKIEGNDEMIGSLNIRKFKTDPKPWPPTPPKTEVRYQEGHPMLFVNDKVLPPYIMTENAFFSYQSFGEHAKTGIHFWRVCVAKGVHSRHNPNNKLQENKDFLAAIDQHIECLLKEDPDAYIIVGTYDFGENQEWTDKNPDDATLLADGRKIQHSFSSRKWIQEVKSDVQGLVKHLMSQPYSGHVVGLHFGVGAGPETYYWGLNTNTYDTKREDVIAGDFSPEHIRAFREWLKEKYHNDVQALQEAWKDPKINFQTASPDINILRKEDLIAFKDPALTRMPLDYWEFHSDVMAQRVIDIGKTVKEASNGKYITGCWGFYSNGENSVPGSPGRLQHAAFAGLQKVLESPYIDYLTGEQAYINVRWGTPVIGMNLMDSIRRHGKMVLTEYDVRTFFTLLQHTERTFSQQETLSVINRDTISAGIRGDACWWVGFPEGNQGRGSVPWFSEESIIEALKNGNRLYQAMYQQNLESVSEIAVFMNNADVYDLDLVLGYGLLASTQFNTLNNELTRLGTPFDLYHLDDVALDGMDQYKVYLFLNAFNVNQKQKENIKKLLSKKGKTIVWIYAPGFCDATKLSIENIKDLTGFQVGYDRVKSLPEAIINPQHTFTHGVEPGHKIKPTRYLYNRRPLEIGPIFYINDPSAEVLGRYVGNNKPAYAYKKVGENNLLYMAIPYLDAPLLRAICKAAGVHRYADNDVYLDATRHFISITSTSQGYDKIIHLLNQNTIYNVLTGQSCGKNMDHFQAIVPPLTTALYYYGTDEEVKKFIESFHHNNSQK